MGLSPNMGLTLPTVTVTTGPTYANNVNSDLTLIDAHDHSSGKGVAITPAGINISSDLTFAQNNATNLRTARLYNNSSFTAGVNDLTCLYALNNELYYRDGAGNTVQLTLGGAIDVSASLTSLTIADNKFSLEYYGDTSRVYGFSGANLPTSSNTIFSVPNSGNDTLVTNTSTSLMSNKSLFTNTCSFIDVIDNTRTIAFSCASNSTGKTLTIKSQQTNSETISFPNITGADTLATLGLAQTFSAAKTFTAAINMNAQNAINFLNSGSTYGTSLSGGANTANYAAILPIADGSNGQCLSTNGSGQWGWSTVATNTANVSANDSNVTFTNASGRYQVCTPTANRTYTLPTTSIVQGDTWKFYNTATAYYITIQSSGSNTITIVPPLGYVELIANVATPTTAGNWTLVKRSSKWVSYTPTITGMGTCTNVNFFYKYEDDSCWIRFYFTAGTVTASAATITFPGPCVLNTSAIYAGSNAGTAIMTTEATASNFYIFLNSSDTTTALFGYQNSSSASLSGQNGSTISGNNVSWSGMFEVPST